MGHVAGGGVGLACVGRKGDREVCQVSYWVSDRWGWGTGKEIARQTRYRKGRDEGQQEGNAAPSTESPGPVNDGMHILFLQRMERPVAAPAAAL